MALRQLKEKYQKACLSTSKDLGKPKKETETSSNHSQLHADKDKGK